MLTGHPERRFDFSFPGTATRYQVHLQSASESSDISEMFTRRVPQSAIQPPALYKTGLRRRYKRQLNEAPRRRRVVHPLCGFSIVLGLGPEDVGNESLRVTIVQGKPARLHLHHDAMAG